MKSKFETGFAGIDEYLSNQPVEIRERLFQICQAVREAAPGAEGKISYKMPAFFYKGRLVYFSNFKRHIGFYPASMRVFESFRDELAGYKQSGRGTVQFPHDEDIPIGLIKKIVEFRVAENNRKEGAAGKPD